MTREKKDAWCKARVKRLERLTLTYKNWAAGQGSNTVFMHTDTESCWNGTQLLCVWNSRLRTWLYFPSSFPIPSSITIFTLKGAKGFSKVNAPATGQACMRQRWCWILALVLNLDFVRWSRPQKYKTTGQSKNKIIILQKGKGLEIVPENEKLHGFSSRRQWDVGSKWSDTTLALSLTNFIMGKLSNFSHFCIHTVGTVVSTTQYHCQDSDPSLELHNVWHNGMTDEVAVSSITKGRRAGNKSVTQQNPRYCAKCSTNVIHLFPAIPLWGRLPPPLLLRKLLGKESNNFSRSKASKLGREIRIWTQNCLKSKIMTLPKCMTMLLFLLIISSRVCVCVCERNKNCLTDNHLTKLL